MIIKSFIPELDLWTYNILYNNDLTSSYVNVPVKLSDKWRCRDSVIELLFNETFDPSGKLYDRNLPFIYKYKTVNEKRIYPFDPVLHRRLQIYPNKYVWCASDPDNQDFLDIQNEVIPTFTNGTDGSGYYYGINPTKYVTKYKSVIITTSNDELHLELPNEEDEDDQKEPTCYGPDENVFGLTEEELEMCQFLYYYRTNQLELIHCFPCDAYYKLRSPLSKWVYLYLQCYVFNIVNYEYLNTITTSDDGMIRCLFEKHAQDRIYQYIQKQHTTIYNEVQDIGANQLKRVFEDYTMPCLTYLYRNRISEQNIYDSYIVLDLTQENQPIENSNFEFIYDGKLLKNGIDYFVINEGNEKETHIEVKLKNKNDFKIGTRYQLMWSCLVLTSPQSRIKGFTKD